MRCINRDGGGGAAAAAAAVVQAPIFGLDNKPQSFMNKITFRMQRTINTRLTRKPELVYSSISSMYNQSFLRRGLYLYCKLPDFYLSMNILTFKKQIKEFIKLNYNKDKIPKIEDFY